MSDPTPSAETDARCWRSECRTGCYYPDACSESRSASTHSFTDVRCDHPGLDHNVQWSYCWPCPNCGVCKFIGHGPLCGDCATNINPPGSPQPDTSAGEAS